MTAALLDREARSLVTRLRVWTPTRWAAATEHGVPRAEVAHHLAQVLADAEADLTGHARRPVPRLDSDLALPDQLAVTADDLVRAAPPDESASQATAHLLLHRADLLADEIPKGLREAVGVQAFTAARAACPYRHPAGAG